MKSTVSPSVAREDIELRFIWKWIRVVGSLVGLAGLIGLFGLLSQPSWGATPPGANPAPPQAPRERRGGFQSGPPARSAQNPFAGAPVVDDEDDEDDTAAAPGSTFGNQGGFQNPQGMTAVGAPGGQNARNNPSGATGGITGVSLGGSAGGGVVSHNDSPFLHVDTDTGDGARQVVTDFNFPDADIMDIAKALGKLTGKNFILDKDVKGRITIISNGPITVGDAWRAFLTALDINQFALIPSGKFIRIARQRDAREKQIPAYTGEISPNTDALITRVIPLKYLSAEEVNRNLKSFMPLSARMVPYEQTNTIIVTDTGANIQKLVKLLEILDVEGYDAGIEVIPVKFASAVELSKLIDTLIPGTSAGGQNAAPRFGVSQSRFTARRTKEGGIINTIIGDERTNTLIVHANSKGADQVRELVAKLDQRLPASGGASKVHVVYLQFAASKQIADTLNNISQTSSTAKPGGASPAGGTGVNPVQASLFEGSIKIAADEATNSLVITASPTDFVTVQRVINQLDIPRDQVFAECVIMEVNIDHETHYSANLISPGSKIGSVTDPGAIAGLLASPLASKGLILGGGAGGNSSLQVNGTTITVPGVIGIINMIQSNSLGNVLATPQILALDNTDATFSSTEKIPIVKNTVVANVGVQPSIDYTPVPLSIKIKPQINKLANIIKMDVTIQSSSVLNQDVPSALAGQASATLERQSQTSIVVADKDTVVIGGLIRDEKSNTESKIPILGDIPLLGWLFRSSNPHVKKTNLLVFITPQIIRPYERIREVLDRKLKERDEFLEAGTGGEDPHRKYRDDMIRSLPDIKEISNYHAKRSFTIGDEDKKDDNSFAAPVNPATGKSGLKQQPPVIEGKNGAAPTTEAPVMPVPPAVPTQAAPPEFQQASPPVIPPMQEAAPPVAPQVPEGVQQ